MHRKRDDNDRKRKDRAEGTAEAYFGSDNRI